MSMFDKMMLMGAKIERQSSDTIGGSNWQIGGIPIYGRDMGRVLKLVEKSLASNKNKLWIATVNPEFVMLASKNERFMQILHKTKLNVPDGIGLIWAKLVIGKQRSVISRLVRGFRVGIDILRGKYGEQVVNGADLMGEFCKMGKKVFFLGGFGNRAEKTGKKLRVTSYEFSRGMPNVKNDVVIKQINNFEPDFLFVAYGMKKQEEWIEANLDKLKVKVVMGVGRSFDYYSGELKRAPSWVRRMGMEWLFSLIMEPGRWRRQLVLPIFVVKVIFGF